MSTVYISWRGISGLSNFGGLRPLCSTTAPQLGGDKFSVKTTANRVFEVLRTRGMICVACERCVTPGASTALTCSSCTSASPRSSKTPNVSYLEQSGAAQMQKTGSRCCAKATTRCGRRSRPLEGARHNDPGRRRRLQARRMPRSSRSRGSLAATAQTPRRVERFLRTLLELWAYAYPYQQEDERAAALAPTLDFYNRFRGHRALGGLTPLQRVNNLSGTNIYSHRVGGDGPSLPLRGSARAAALDAPTARMRRRRTLIRRLRNHSGRRTV
jgi:hypothetical protein